MPKELNNNVIETEDHLENHNSSNQINSSWIDLLQSLEEEITDDETEELIRNVCLILSYSLIVIVSLAGNLLVCKVVYELKDARTTTNVLIGNLAISDLLMTILNIPFNIARVVLDNWPFGETLCILVPFIQSTSAHCSSITMMVIAIERYRSLIHNTHINGNCFCKCMPFANILLIIWFLAAMFSLPHGIFNQVLEVYTWRRLIRCRVTYPEPYQEFRQRLTLVTFLSQYLIPIFLTCICYLRIGFFLWRKEIVGTQSEFHRLSLLRRKKRRIKMLIIVVFVFAISWLPLNVYHLLTDFNIINYRSTLFFVVHWFAMSSVCYNPFIYCWLNENFRRKAKTLFNFMPITNERITSSIPNDTLCEQIQLNTVQSETTLQNELNESRESVGNNKESKNGITVTMVHI